LLELAAIPQRLAHPFIYPDGSSGMFGIKVILVQNRCLVEPPESSISIKFAAYPIEICLRYSGRRQQDKGQCPACAKQIPRNRMLICKMVIIIHDLESVPPLRMDIFQARHSYDRSPLYRHPVVQGGLGRSPCAPYPKDVNCRNSLIRGRLGQSPLVFAGLLFGRLLLGGI